MCKLKADGGRCRYADMISVIRRKYRRRNPGIREDKLAKLVREDIAANPELAWHEAQRHTNAQWAPPKWSVPESLTKDMHPVGALPKSIPTAQELYDQNEVWMDALDKKERNAVVQYSMNGYIGINGVLRGTKGWHHSSLIQKAHLQQEKQRVQEQVTSIDTALEKAPATERNQPLYRYYKVPDGVPVDRYVKEILLATGGHKDKGFLSTTANPLHALAAIYKRNDSLDLNGYVVMEIWTRRGASLQRDEEARPGDVQSQEQEVLLPRNMGLRFLESGKMRHQFDEVPVELENRFNNRSIIGRKLSVPLLRMIDEELVREERNRFR